MPWKEGSLSQNQCYQKFFSFSQFPKNVYSLFKRQQSLVQQKQFPCLIAQYLIGAAIIFMRAHLQQRPIPRGTIQTAEESAPQHPFPHCAYQPFATTKVRKGADWFKATGKGREIVRNLAVSPFQRIKRVQKLIYQHRRQSGQESQTLQAAIINNSSLKPVLKIKNSKLSEHRHSNDWSEKPKQPQNLQQRHVTLECITVTSFSPRANSHEKNLSNNGFQQTFKNRCKLHRRKQYRTNEVSLLEMLNRVSQKTPLQRYKSRAFESARRVEPLRFWN